MSQSQQKRLMFGVRVAVIGVTAALLVLGLSGIFSKGVSVNAQGSSIFAQLSSLETQQPSSTSPKLMNFDQRDGLSGMGFDPAHPSDLKVQTTGSYFVIAAGQVGKTSAGAADDYVDIWIKVNGIDVGNSNTRQAIGSASFTAVLVSQGVLLLNAGDVIQVAYSVSDTGQGLGIIATEPAGEAAIPSVILSAFRMQ
jgi:hypothetical protein